MAQTDPDQPGSERWVFREWLDGVIGYFTGGKRVIVDGGGIRPIGNPPPPTALLARKRAMGADRGGMLSRMERAKRKNMMWANNLQPLVLERLKSNFHPENYSRMRLMPSLWTNQMRRIVEDISILYENPARRYLADEEEEQRKEEAKFAIREKAKEMKAEQHAARQEQMRSQMEAAQEGKPAPIPEPQDMPEAPTDDLQTGDPDIDALADVLDLEGADGENETPLDKLLAHVDLDTVMDYVEKMTRIHECVWVRPYVSYKTLKPTAETKDTASPELEGDPADATLTYIIYDPSCADVVEDPENPERALAWYYWSKELGPDGNYRIVIHFWTDEQYWKLDAEWKTIKGPLKNEYGQIPVQEFRKEKPSTGSYYCEGVGDDLYDATLELCVLRTIQNTRYRDAGFKQLAITGDEENVPADQVMGGPTPIYLPQDGSATVLDMEPRLAEMNDVLDQRSLEQAAGKGITQASYKSESAPQSGFAKKLDRDKVLKENKRIRKFFDKGEQGLYKLTALTLEQHPVEDIDKLDAEAEFGIDFAEPSFEEDPRHQATIDAQNIKLNKTNIIDILSRENPDLNEKELVELAYRNKRINEAFIPQETNKLMDLLATGAQVGGSFGALGGGGGPPKGGPDAGGKQPNEAPQEE